MPLSTRKGQDKGYFIPIIQGGFQGLRLIKMDRSIIDESTPGWDESIPIIVEMATKLGAEAGHKFIDQGLDSGLFSQRELEPISPSCIVQRGIEAYAKIHRSLAFLTQPPSLPLVSRSSAISLRPSRSRPVLVGKPVSGSNLRSS